MIRLAGKGGKLRSVPNRILNHAAVLTYMIGDEPKLDELEVYRRAFEAVTKRYSNRRPITATIYDGWGLGSEGDPDIVFNDALADLPLRRFGRMYCFRRLDYGRLRPVEYKRWQDVASIFNALEISSKESWWLAPQFFGHENSHPYWRIWRGCSADPREPDMAMSDV